MTDQSKQDDQQRFVMKASRLQDDLETIRSTGAKRVSLNGFESKWAGDLSFLSDLTNIDDVLVHRSDAFDLSPIQNMKWLKALRLDGAPRSIRLGDMPSLRLLACNAAKGLEASLDGAKLDSLHLHKFKPPSRDLSTLPRMPLEHLTLVQGNLLSIKGIERFAELEQLEVHYLRTLQSIESLRDFKNARLSLLHLEHCPNIESFESISSLSSLKKLLIIGCRGISSIAFLKQGLDHLEFVTISRTRIADCDVRPLLSLSKLKYVYFENVKGYNMTLKDVRAPFGIKDPTEAHRDSLFQ